MIQTNIIDLLVDYLLFTSENKTLVEQLKRNSCRKLRVSIYVQRVISNFDLSKTNFISSVIGKKIDIKVNIDTGKR